MTRENAKTPNVKATTVLLSKREKRQIIGVIYREWSKKEFDSYLKIIDSLIKDLKKEKDDILNGSYVEKKEIEQDKLIENEVYDLLIENGFVKSIT